MHLPLFKIPGYWLAVVLAALLLSACQEAPDVHQVTRTVEARLSQAFGPETFALTSLRRMGRGPLSADDQGQPQRIVYYNAVLTLARDLDFSSWSNLNAAAFATLLGATEKGVSGLHQAGNRRGDRVYVHGSVSFARDGGTWTPIATVLPEVGTPSAPLSPATSAQSKQLYERLMQLYERQSTDPKRQRQIIAEELGHAYTTITERLDRLDRVLTLAGGPPGGEYQAVADLLAQTLTARGRTADARSTAGSVQNLQLLRGRHVDLALVQNNLAAATLPGAGATHDRLVALASLFPEPVQVLVARGSALTDLRDLAGKRVEIGQPDSGSRVNAVLLLPAAGVDLLALGAVHEDGLEQGLVDLAAGRIDAVIATISAPARLIAQAAARSEVQLLSVSPEVQAALTHQGAGLIPLELPPATYPGQLQPVRTLAVTALLVAAPDLPGADVEQVLGALFGGSDFLGAGSMAGSQISRQNAATGLTLPLHPAVPAFFAHDPLPTH